MRAMLKLSYRSLTAHKLRFALTTFAVLLGVSFVVASFVVKDGLMRTFNTIVEDANAAVDVEIRARDEFAEIGPLLHIVEGQFNARLRNDPARLSSTRS